MEEKRLSPQGDGLIASSQRPPRRQHLRISVERDADASSSLVHSPLNLNTRTSPNTRLRSTAGSQQSPVTTQTRHSRPGSFDSTTSSATLIPSPYPSPSPHSYTPKSSRYMAPRNPYPSDRPLIDYVNNDWKNAHDLDASDEDDAFYRKGEEDEHWIHPKWRNTFSSYSNRVPRRLQRYLLIYLSLLFVTWISWRSYIGPNWRLYREELRKMDTEPPSAYGSNMRPDFEDMIQVKTMDSQLLPTGEGDSKTKRLVIIGDVHGCKEELEALLKKVDFNENHDHLILTGDIIAKGPDSPGVVSLASSLSASCVRGNHEDRTLLALADMHRHHVPLPGPDESPDRVQDTLDEESFSHGDYKSRRLAKQFSEDQIKYLKSCPVILRVGEISGMGEILVVHGGLVPNIPLERQDPFQVMNMRSIDLETRMPSEDRDGTPWEKFWNHQQKKLPVQERKTVVYGHNSKKGLNIKKYSMGLDSACVNGGELTALVIEAGKKGRDAKTNLVSVKCKGYKK